MSQAFYDLEAIPDHLREYFGPVQSSFLDQTGVFRQGFCRALALIIAQGNDPASPAIEKRLALACSHTDSAAELAGSLLSTPQFFHGLPKRSQAAIVKFLSAIAEEKLVFEQLDDAETTLPALLSIRGIGPETAENILLYALNLPFIPVSAGLYRIANRHGHIPEMPEREEIRDFYAGFFPEEPALMRHIHTHLLKVGRLFCKASAASCTTCPLKDMM